ncbi:unnamed protein product [Allacma fusca]|uniref:Uncharacterized protein n=1 Tax=Allacma fusca TaxID=39272 RepID=A0A8J2JNU9_9HEXA|nr:unnamed protein product [Allacma fusca]
MIVVLASIAALCIVGTAVDLQSVYSTEGKLSKPGKFTKIILAFSFYTNTKKFLMDMKKILTDMSLAPVLNGTPSVYTFFTLSGALVAYNFLKELDKRKGKFNYFMFVIHRYLRLTPTYAIVIGLMATLVPYFGNGPYWFALEQDNANCRKYWWHNLLYFNNLVKYEAGLCYSESCRYPSDGVGSNGNLLDSV